MGTPMLGMPAYTENMAQQGQTSIVPGQGAMGMGGENGQLPYGYIDYNGPPLDSLFPKSQFMELMNSQGYGGSSPGMGGKGGMMSGMGGMGGMPADAPPGTMLGQPVDTPRINIPQQPPMVPPQSGTPGRPVPVEPFTPAGPGLANPGAIGVNPSLQPPPPLQQAQPQRPPTLAQRQPNMPARLQAPLRVGPGPMNPPPSAGRGSNAGRGPSPQKVRTAGAGRGGLLGR